MKLPSLLQNRSIQVGLAIVTIIILLAIFAGQDARRTDPSSSPLPSPERLEIIDLNEEKRRQAADYRRQIATSLPIYREAFPTSVGFETSINIYYLPSDPAEVVRLEIYGLSYLNSDPVKNPNVTAFKESYLEAMKLLKDKGIDPKKLIFIYGDKEYVRTTTLIWLDALKLKP